MSSYTNLSAHSHFMQFVNEETGAAQFIHIPSIECVGVNAEFCSIYLYSGAKLTVEPHWYLQVISVWQSYHNT